MWLTLIFFFPVGVALLWINKFYTNGMRIFLSIVFGFLFFNVAISSNDEANEPIVVEETETKELSAEKEQLAEEKKRLEEERKQFKEETKIKEAEEKRLAEEKAKKEAAVTQQKEQEKKASQLGLTLVTVTKVIDGDTFEIAGGKKVRLIGVNAPESTTEQEEYGKEASDYTISLLSGKEIYLQKDVSDTDQYGRILRVAWLEIPTDVTNDEEIRTKMVNANLVLNGYAEPSTYPPDVTYSELFVKFAREARENKKGLWAFGENGTTKGDLDVQAEEPVTVSKPAVNTSPITEPTATYESYKNCTELRKVHPSGVGADHSAYESKHDRDKDGWACE